MESFQQLDETNGASSQIYVKCLTSIRVFSHMHRNANFGIFVFTVWKKKSSDKMLTLVGILSPTLSFLH